MEQQLPLQQPVPAPIGPTSNQPIVIRGPPTPKLNINIKGLMADRDPFTGKLMEPKEVKESKEDVVAPKSIRINIVKPGGTPAETAPSLTKPMSDAGVPQLGATVDDVAPNPAAEKNYVSSVKYRNWCYTLNNYSNEEMLQLRSIECIYHVHGHEVAASGTPHLQGFICFKNTRVLGGMKQLNKRAHWAPRYRESTNKQAADYCKKDGQFWEHGTIPTDEQGKRTDLISIGDMIKRGDRMDQIIESGAIKGYSHLRYAEALSKYREKERNFKPQVLWFYGPSGTGKTRLAFEMTSNPWVSMRNLKWWEGYDGHEHVIIDDFRADFCTYHEILRILDRYPYRVEVKGGSRQLLAKLIIITCPFSPYDVYNKTDEELKQLLRRIDAVYSFTALGQYTINSDPSATIARAAELEQKSGGNTIAPRLLFAGIAAAPPDTAGVPPAPTNVQGSGINK